MAKTMAKQDSMTAVIEEAKQEVALEDMPLTSLKEYRLYNEKARKMTIAAKKRDKKLKIAPYPILQCPIEFHPTQRIIVTRNDNQGQNYIPVYLSNHLIHYDKKLIPGTEYDLPECVIRHLESKGHPIWKWRDVGKDGARETFIDSYDPRFSLRTVRTYED